MSLDLNNKDGSLEDEWEVVGRISVEETLLESLDSLGRKEVRR